MNYLAIDVGTTAVKLALYDKETTEICFYTEEFPLLCIDNFNYVNIDRISDYILSVTNEISKKYTISGISVSSLGESFVALDKNDNIVFYPMLYTDKRGEEEADKISKKIDIKNIFEITGTIPNSMFSIYKILYIKNNLSDIYKKIDKIMLVSEYITYLFTGKRVIDYGLASRTGIFDIKNKCFSKELLNELDIDFNLFSEPKITGSFVGEVKKDNKKLNNLKNICKVFTGSHDQICSAIGAGALKKGNYVDGMGTVECITAIFDKKINNDKMGKEGYTCVPFLENNLYCAYLLNYTSGSLVNWLRKKILGSSNFNGKSFFEHAEENMSNSPTTLLTLPYFEGASTPYQDNEISGAIIGLNLNTSVSDIYKSIMESTSFEMKLNVEMMKEYGADIKNLVATGGSSKSDKWLQIKADIMNVNVTKLISTEAGLTGTAMISAVGLNDYESLEDASKVFVKYGKTFYPRQEYIEQYNKKYEKYKKLYKGIKELI